MGAHWGNVGQSWGHIGVILGLSWGLGGVLASTLGLHHRTCSSNKESAYMIEMYKSLSPGPCRVKTLVFKKKMSSNIEITHFIEMPKSRSLCLCRGKTLARCHTSANRQAATDCKTNQKQHVFEDFRVRLKFEAKCPRAGSL